MDSQTRCGCGESFVSLLEKEMELCVKCIRDMKDAHTKLVEASREWDVEREKASEVESAYSRRMTLDIAEMEGRTAAKEGFDVGQNPFVADDECRTMWEHGHSIQTLFRTVDGMKITLSAAMLDLTRIRDLAVELGPQEVAQKLQDVIVRLAELANDVL